MLNDVTTRLTDRPPLVSVVVVARNQHGQVANTMAGLSTLMNKSPELSTEVVVVDNASEPPLRAVIERELPSAVVIRRDLEPPYFKPGSARNAGAAMARGRLLVFLDGDCVPSPGFLESHVERLLLGPCVTLGHRRFVDDTGLTPELVRAAKCDLRSLPDIASGSNYGLPLDRRLDALRKLETHPMPFDCCHGCNFGVPEEAFAAAGGFDPEFEGSWGYEDIELGHRLHQAGLPFAYVEDAFVVHQEGGTQLTRAGRAEGGFRNFRIACQKIPGFADFRRRHPKAYYAHT